MQKFILLVGLSGSGKSAIAQQLEEDENAITVSSDAIRKHLFGDESIQGDNNKVFGIAHNDIVDALNRGWNVIFDATNLNRKNRRNILNKIPKDVEKKCIIVATDYDTCLERNNNRDRHVLEEVIKRQRESFQIPSYQEGWDKIEILFNDYDKKKYDLETLVTTMSDFNQHNSHHTMSLGEHTLSVHDRVVMATDDGNLEMAALMHDVGKLYTKTFSTMKGIPTTDAHYFNHQNVGAYESLFYMDKEGLREKLNLDISLLVQWHMQPYFMDTEKSKQKFIAEFGQEFYDRLMILHEADEEAH